MAEYEVVHPDSNYRGRSYSSWATDWFNHFLSVDPDKHISGPVVFLKSVPSAMIPNEVRSNPSNDSGVSNIYSSETFFPRKYENIPNVMIGPDRIQIFTDQAVLWPLGVAFEMATKPFMEWGHLQEYTGSIMDHGDDPPDVTDIRINSKPINLPPKVEMSMFRILTPVFTAIVPDVEYGRSLKDFGEEDIPVGHWPTILDGYFVLLRFKTPKRYALHSLTKAGREVHGRYASEIFCEIEVNDGPRKLPSRGIPPTIRPARNEGVIARVISQKIEMGELTVDEANTFMSNAGLQPVFKNKK